METLELRTIFYILKKLLYKINIKSNTADEKISELPDN